MTASTIQNNRQSYADSRRAKQVGVLQSVGIHLVFIVMGFFALIPFFFMISGSFMAEGEIFSLQPHFIPKDIIWTNYVELFQRFPFLTYLRNSIIISLTNTIGVLFFCSLIGFIFAKRRFPGRSILFLFVLGTVMLPGGITIIIPWYLLMVRLGWVNTFWPLIIPWLTPALNIFLMRQYIRTGVPDELLDSAKLDGASLLAMYWHIVLPLVKPGLAAVGILQFIAIWNDFLFSLLILQKDEMRTATVALTVLSMRTVQASQYGPLFAGIVLATLPTLLVFIIFQRRLTRGILAGALRG
jgi:ABC-type glycerol-3-phosphate transport system permease component